MINLKEALSSLVSSEVELNSEQLIKHNENINKSMVLFMNDTLSFNFATISYMSLPSGEDRRGPSSKHFSLLRINPATPF